MSVCPGTTGLARYMSAQAPSTPSPLSGSHSGEDRAGLDDNSPEATGDSAGVSDGAGDSDRDPIEMVGVGDGDGNGVDDRHMDGDGDRDRDGRIPTAQSTSPYRLDQTIDKGGNAQLISHATLE